jgi:hypothetical protein
VASAARWATAWRPAAAGAGVGTEHGGQLVGPRFGGGGGGAGFGSFPLG